MRMDLGGRWSGLLVGGIFVASLGGCGGCGLTTPGTEDTLDSGGAQTQQDGGTNTVGDGGTGASSSGGGSSGTRSSSTNTSSAVGSSSGANGSSTVNTSSGSSDPSSGTGSSAGASSGGISSSADPSSGAGSSGGGSSVGGSTSADPSSGGGSSAGGSSVGGSSVGGSSVGGSSVGGSSVGGSSVGGSSVGGSSSVGGGSSVGGSSSIGVPSSGGGVSSSSGGSSGTPCPPLTLGGATEDIYVDKGVPMTGNGTITCPFATILEASSLAAPGNAVTQRTIHVRGYAGGTLAATYSEAAPIILSPRVRLTSNYDAGNPGGVALVRIVASGSCLSITGAAANCAVGMENNSVLELVTVTTRGGAAQTHAIATTNAATPPGGTPPTIRNVNAEGATANGILVSSSAALGPAVNATGNAFNGLQVQIGNLGPAVGRPSVSILDVASGALTPSNHFSNNTRNGAAFFGDVAIQVDGLVADGNSNNGLIIATPLFANIAGQPTHTLANVISTNNSNHGLRLNSGDVLLQAGSLTNAFNNNGGHGIDSSVGDSLGNARLVTQPSTSITGAYLIAHQANSNRLGGVHLNQVTPLGYGPHVIESLEALRNGVAAGSVALASGVFVEVTGANQPSVTLRGNTLMGNAGAGVRFQKAQNNALDIGTFTGIVQDGGENVFAAPGGGANAKSALCVENLTLGNVVQEVEENRWVTLPCPFPMLPPVNPAFIAQLNGICGSNAAYVDITYATVPTTTVTFSAQTCF